MLIVLPPLSPEEAERLAAMSPEEAHADFIARAREAMRADQPTANDRRPPVAPKTKPVRTPGSVVTNPSATRLPRQLGTFDPAVAPVEPIRPKQIPKSRQRPKSGPNVVVTNPRALPAGD